MKIRLGFVMLVAFLGSFVVCTVAAFAQPAHYVGSTYVKGQVLSKSSDGGEWMLSSDSGWGLNITLYKLDLQTQQLLWISNSNCWEDEGCADQFGNFQFTKDYFGSDLEQGDYEIEATANGHLVSRTRFNLNRGGVQVKLLLRMSPVYLELTSTSGTIPSHGGILKAKVKVWNFDTKLGSIPVNAMIYGPTRTQVYEQYQIELSPLFVPENRWESSEAEVGVQIPSDAPDGRMYCVNFRLGIPGETLADTWVCAMKGGLTHQPQPSPTK